MADSERRKTVTKDSVLPIPPDGTFNYILEQFSNHDQTCTSLPTIWFGHKGGYTSMGDTITCNGCDVFFWSDGIFHVIEEPESDYVYCGCCVGNHPKTRERLIEEGI